MTAQYGEGKAEEIKQALYTLFGTAIVEQERGGLGTITSDMIDLIFGFGFSLP